MQVDEESDDQEEGDEVSEKIDARRDKLLIWVNFRGRVISSWK